MDLRLYVCLVAGFLLGTTYGQDLSINPAGEHVKRLGEGAVFLCNAAGAEEGTLEWLGKDGSAVPVLGQDPDAANARPQALKVDGALQLMFSQLEDGDEGEYTCRATINGQEQQKSVHLKIYKPITVVNAPAKQTPRIYTDALIVCEVTANPTPTIQWFFSNQDVVQGPRYLQESNGLKIKNITKADNGLYHCRAAIYAQGDLKDIQITVEVTVPPTITVPLAHGKPIAGRPFEMRCQATGDPQPTFLFYKMENNQKVPLEGPKYQVDEIKGELAIETLTVEDEGMYICDATNVGGTANAEVEVDVLVPPRIIEVINSTDKEQGQPEALTCKATGDPAPTMTWRRFDMQSPYASSGGGTQTARVEETTVDRGQYKEVTLKLIFDALQPSDTQNYTCEVENLAGNASQNGHILVKFQPNFDSQAKLHGTTFYGWGGHRTVMKCTADAHPMPSFQWMHNGAVVSENDTFGMTQEVGVRRITSMLSVDVKSGMEFLYGAYVCSATNYIGKSNITLQLQKAEPPGQPTVQANDIKPTAIELLISPPAQDGGQEVLEYVIQYTPENSDTTQTATAVKNPDPVEPRTKHTITGLKASTTYTIAVSARNNVGTGNPFTFSEETTDESAPDPVYLTSEKQGVMASTFELKWNKPLTGGRELTRYRIKYRKVSVVDPDASEWTKDETKEVGTWKEVSPTGEAESYTLTGLSANTYYEVEMEAVNALGESKPTTHIVRTGTAVDPLGVRDSSPSRCSHSSLLLVLALLLLMAFITPSSALPW